MQCKETRALRDPSWISPTSWINFLCLPEPRMSNFFFCFLDRIYCTSSEQRFGCWKSKLLFCNGVSPHLLWIAEQQLLGCVQAFVLLSALCMKRHTVGVLGWWSSRYCCSNIKSQTDHISASFSMAVLCISGGADWDSCKSARRGYAWLEEGYRADWREKSLLWRENKHLTGITLHRLELMKLVWIHGCSSVLISYWK